MTHTMITKKKYAIRLILTLSLMLILGFIGNRKKLINELVMNQGMVIEATNDRGTIIIEAGKDLERIYAWDDRRTKVSMWARKKRWLGSLGIYNPQGGREVHTVVEEGQQHFCSEEEALEWLAWQDKRFHYVYTSDGLVVGWYTSQGPDFFVHL